MRPDDLRLAFASFEISYPPLTKFKGDELTRFYANIYDRHPFESFEQHGDEAAHMSSESERMLIFGRAMMHYEEQVATDFEMVKKRAEDLLNEVQHEFDVSLFRVSGVSLRARWEAEDYATTGAFSDVIRENVLTITPEQYALLGGGQDEDDADKDDEHDHSELPGPGLRFVGTSEDPHRHWDVGIEPYYRDEAQLQINLNMEFFGPVLREPKDLAERLGMADNFLRNNVVEFVQSFMP